MFKQDFLIHLKDEMWALGQFLLSDHSSQVLKPKHRGFTVKLLLVNFMLIYSSENRVVGRPDNPRRVNQVTSVPTSVVRQIFEGYVSKFVILDVCSYRCLYQSAYSWTLEVANTLVHLYSSLFSSIRELSTILAITPAIAVPIHYRLNTFSEVAQ